MSPLPKARHNGAGLAPGTLYIVGTPLGNLADITLRAQHVLAAVDLVAAEDTRRTGRLLEHLEISKPIISYYQHNERSRTDELVQRMMQGETVALVTDAGMPGISDPGTMLIQAALAQGLPVVPVPGPTAATTALVISGLPTDRFAFEGFLPRSGKERRQRLEQMQREERTIVLYEAPHRLVRTLADCVACLGDRPAAVARELTKLHEECIRGPLSAVLAHFQAQPPKGECVLVIGGATPESTTALGTNQAQTATTALDSSAVNAATMQELIAAALQSGYSSRDAAKLVAEQTGLPRRTIYQAVLQLQGTQ